MRSTLLPLLLIACQCFDATAQTQTLNQALTAKTLTKPPSAAPCITLRAYLQGALINNGDAVAPDGRPLMRDNLRSSPFTGNNYIPASNPYEFGTPYFNISGKYSKLAPQDAAHPEFQRVSDSAAVFGVTGQDAIVDWVFVELRDKTNSARVVATRAALIQRDGDIVEVDGKSCLDFAGLPSDSYYVAVRHRSHLAAMTASAQSPEALQTLVDFTVPATPIFDKGTVGIFNFTGLGQKSNAKGTYRALWAGDISQDGKVNMNEDLMIMQANVVNYPGNTNRATSFDLAYGYIQGDYDMNSKAKFDSPNDDNIYLMSQVVNYPLNTDHATSFDLLIQQLP